MERTVIESCDERLGLAVLMLGVRGAAALRAGHAVRATSRLMEVPHQYGGYACLQEVITGVVCPLAWAPAHRDLRPLLGGLEAISEHGAGGGALDRRLLAFGFTSGETLPPEAVSEVFADYLPIPAFTEAWEALAERLPVEPGVFDGWPVWEEAGPRTFDDELRDQLVAAAALSASPLGLYLLWSNSD